jgi:hypothetical protein
MFKKLIAKVVERRLAQHFSVATLFIGVITQLLGITLAPEQISALISGLSVLIYILHQIKK